MPTSFADGDLNTLSNILQFPEATSRQGWKVSAFVACPEIAALLSRKTVPMSPTFGAIPISCLVLDRGVI